ncbi:YesL family protein [Halalkalibacter urbisdiaboli]|uniref:YesL family protein n=1 Tax=Halalkalibacter urbisdiaboli TaxID=1960589 RepID=UPI000B42F1D9|nr:YesL family protein [Halalkalibacter urbisdiaboli]
MQTGGLMGGFYRISEWIMRLAYINILWVAFTLLGLIVFGFMPATAAMFAIIRKWIMKDEDVPIFKTFWSYYKQDFVKVNLLGLSLAIIGYILYIDLQFLQTAAGSWIGILYIPVLVLSLVYYFMLLYIIPVFVHYELKLFQIIKNAFLIMVMNPLANISMIAGLVILYFIMISIPGLIVFFGASTVAFIIMGSAYLAFSKIQKKQEAQNPTEES